MDFPESSRAEPPSPEYVPLRRIRWDVGGGVTLFGHEAWLALLGLAFRYGWRPKGTVEPPHWDFNPWSRSAAAWTGKDYFSTLGQRVSDADAAAMAAALEDALPDIPAHDALGGKSIWMLDLPDSPPIHWVHPGQPVNGIEFFSGPRRSKVDAFVRNCRDGGFTIC